MSTTIQYRAEDEHAIVPYRATPNSAGYDLTSMDAFILKPGCVNVIDTGLRFKIPFGYYGTVLGRSGLAMEGIIIHSGLIDSDYRGTIRCIVRNVTKDKDFIVSKYDRIAQFLLLKHNAINFEESKESDEEFFNTHRGACGFGSTGMQAKLKEPLPPDSQVVDDFADDEGTNDEEERVQLLHTVNSNTDVQIKK